MTATCIASKVRCTSARTEGGGCSRFNPSLDPVISDTELLLVCLPVFVAVVAVVVVAERVAELVTEPIAVVLVKLDNVAVSP